MNIQTNKQFFEELGIFESNENEFSKLNLSQADAEEGKSVTFIRLSCTTIDNKDCE